MSDPPDKNQEKYPKTYLGDGAYATYDGHNIILTTERYSANNTLTTHYIYLEPQVFIALLNFKQTVSEYNNAKASKS